MDAFLSALGLKQGAALGGFLGALVSLKFIDGIGAWPIWKRATTVASGAAVAAYCAPLTIELFELSPKTEGAVAFIGGLFGMSIAGAVIRAMPELISAARERIGGQR